MLASSQNALNLAPLLALPVLFPLVVLQGTVFAYVPIGGVVVQAAIVVTLVVALWRDSAESIIWAFVAGLLIDLNSIAPLGSTAIALIVAVIAIAPFRNNLAYNRVLLPLLLTGGMLFIFQLTTIITFRLSGSPTNADWVTLMPNRILIHTLIIVPIYWIVRSMTAVSRPTSEINL